MELIPMLRGGLVALLLAAGIAPSFAALPPQQLQVPPGFRITLLTDAVPNARAMALGGRTADGDTIVYVGSVSAGKVHAVVLAGDAVKRVVTVASGLDTPAGIAWQGGNLYVATLSRIVRFDAIDTHLADPPAAVLVTDRLPSETHHGAKYIGFGPDGRLYVSVGSPCNVCVPDADHGHIRSMKPDGSDVRIVARGVRNSVGFDWSPLDKALWFTDNGRDMLGDDLPGDELNRVDQAGQEFGFPYCHQGDLPDPQFGAQRRCSEFVAPQAKLGAHVAALGMRFYTGSQFPAAYRGNVFVAEHGSWNRSRKSGYQVARVVLDAQGKVLRQEPFVQGWLRSDAEGRETVAGRPADVLVLPDGSLLVSDDFGGAIYRVRHAP